MVRVKKNRIVISIILLIILYSIYKLYIKNEINVNKVPKEILKFPRLRKISYQDLSELTIIIIEFESFDNDVLGTALSVLSACEYKCKVFIVSEDIIYPPLEIPKGAKHIILKADILKSEPNMKSLLQLSKYILFLPDGARISSETQLKDQIHVLETGDFQVVALGIGGSPLNCYQYSLDIRAWTLVISPTPHSEACDGISGKAAMLLRTSHLTNLTFPLARPTALSLSIQGVARGWKIHVGRGAILGEGKHLYSSDHFQWKYQTLEEERVKALYINLGIKKVVESNRRVEWYGCTRNSPRCFPTIINETPSYLYRGRWTPPCCLEGLRITARHVFQTLHSCRVRWWLEGGSLLGAVRSGDIIPWDYDVDIGIYASDLDRCPQLKSSRWQTLEDSKGFVWQKASEGNYYRVHYSTANHLHVDIFPFQVRDGMMVRGGAWNTGHKQDIDFPEHYLRPLSNIMFIGVTAAAPNNVRDFLEMKFGLGVIENPQYPNTDALNGLNFSAPSIL